MSSEISLRARISIMALVVLVVFLLASFLHEAERRKEADAKRDKAISELVKTNEGIVTKLTEVFAQAQAAEQAAREAGEVPETTVAAVAESLRGYVDPALIQRAIDAAKQSAQGKPGPQGPAGPPGRSAESPTTTSTVGTTTTSSATTTSTTQPPPPTTTTTVPPRQCTVGLNIPGLARVCV